VHHQRPASRSGGQCTWSEPAIYGVQACGVKLWLAPFGISEFSLAPGSKSAIYPPPSRPTEGRCARHGRGAGCGGRRRR
jgi:hypothetical protein